MTIKWFRVAASVLIIFNVVGTVVTWTGKAGTSHTHAIFGGTEFAGPILFIGLWILFVLLTLAQGKPRMIGVALMTVFAAVFTTGEAHELFKSNVGISTGQMGLRSRRMRLRYPNRARYPDLRHRLLRELPRR